jgi:hypothetical protein
LEFEGAVCTSRLPLDFQRLGGLLDRTGRRSSFVALLVGGDSRFGVDGSDEPLWRFGVEHEGAVWLSQTPLACSGAEIGAGEITVGGADLLCHVYLLMTVTAVASE